MDRQAILAMPAAKPPEGVEPNFAHPSNLNGLANGVAIAALTVTSITIVVRLHSWIFILKSLTGRLEAALVLSGFASYIGFTYCLFHVVDAEIGWWVHQWDVTVGDTIGFSYWVYIGGILYNSAIAPVKVAILIEWMRIFSPHSRNAFYWLCQVVLWLNIVYYTAATIVESMQCTPRELIWDPTVKGWCLNTKAVEVISASVNVVSDIVILVAPQFVIWRLQLSKAKKIGVALIFAVGLFGSISAIFRLVATQNYLRSKDATYSVAAVGYWALSEMTSVFIVYGMPAIPAACHGASTRLSQYYTQWTRGSSGGRTGDNSGAHHDNPWREGATGPSRKYRNLDKNSLPLNSLDTSTTTQWTTTMVDHDPPTPPTSMYVLRTVEIMSEESRNDEPESSKRDTGEEVLLRQHPWVKTG